MKMKKLLLTIAATLGMTAAIMAQNVPNYVPTNGLVGWWPFNGNANDESGNGNNGTVYAAALTEDRFGVANNSFVFEDTPDKITVAGNIELQLANTFTIASWVRPLNNTYGTGPNYHAIVEKWGSNGDASYLFALTPEGKPLMATHNGNNFLLNSNTTIPFDNWSFLVYTQDENIGSIYINGVLDTTSNNMATPQPNNNPLLFASNDAYNQDWIGDAYEGTLDDIGIWNRALTQEEISNLYSATNCSNNLTISPATNHLEIASTANFVATTSDPNPSYVWQSNFGQGFQTLNDYGNYSGANNSTLNISNVQLQNHTQPIRVITTSGNCIDTSNVAIISIADTCINTITDTTLITVTDTLLINTTITGLNPPNNANTIKVFPNPTNDHITIDYGNFSVMNGYQLKIENSLGQQVFQTNITQQSDYLNLTTWGGNGLYFVHIIDPQGNTIDIKKIVLQ